MVTLERYIGLSYFEWNILVTSHEEGIVNGGGSPRPGKMNSIVSVRRTHSASALSLSGMRWRSSSLASTIMIGPCGSRLNEAYSISINYISNCWKYSSMYSISLLGKILSSISWHMSFRELMICIFSPSPKKSWSPLLRGALEVIQINDICLKRRSYPNLNSVIFLCLIK